MRQEDANDSPHHVPKTKGGVNDAAILVGLASRLLATGVNKAMPTMTPKADTISPAEDSITYTYDCATWMVQVTMECTMILTAGQANITVEDSLLTKGVIGSYTPFHTSSGDPLNSMGEQVVCTLSALVLAPLEVEITTEGMTCRAES